MFKRNIIRISCSAHNWCYTVNKGGVVRAWLASRKREWARPPHADETKAWPAGLVHHAGWIDPTKLKYLANKL